MLGRPDITGAGFDTLQVMDGAMYLKQAILVKACLLELTIHVGSDDKGIQRQMRDPGAQRCHPRMGSGISIQMQTVPVESPGKGGIGEESPGIGHLNER